MRRFLLIAAAGAIVLVGLSANQCGSDQTQQSAPASPPAESTPPATPAPASPPAETPATPEQPAQPPAQ